MGNSATAKFAFGFNLGSDEDFDEGLMSLVEKTSDCEDKDWPIELLKHGHYDYPSWFLSVRNTERRSVDWGHVVAIATPEVATTAIDAAKVFCFENGITWQEPGWFAMATYG